MKMNTFLVIINFILLAIGNCGGPLMMRLYYTNGGQRIWFSSFLQTVAFPLLLFPLLSSFFLRRRNRNRLRDEEANIKYFHMKPPLLLASIVTGLLMGLDNYLYSYGLAYIPVSTASLILSAQLGFTALFTFFMVKQKLTAYTVNAVVLLTVGAVVLALNTDGDEVDDGETKKEYVVGFVMTVCGSLLYAFVLPLVEYSYKRSGQRITFTLVVEFQIVLCFVATCFCLVGMIVSGDFKVIAKEAREFKLGESLYYVVVVFTAVIWQSFFVGAIGLIFCASSLVSGIMISVLLPVTVILAVICFHEKFHAGKGVALVLCIWGSVSYFYGQVKTEEKTKTNETQELSEIQVTDSIA